MGLTGERAVYDVLLEGLALAPCGLVVGTSRQEGLQVALGGGGVLALPCKTLELYV